MLEPSHDSATSQAPAFGRHTRPLSLSYLQPVTVQEVEAQVCSLVWQVASSRAGSLVGLPTQLPFASQASLWVQAMLSLHGVLAGLKTAAGHAGLVPSHLSGGSHSVFAGSPARHTTS